MAAGTRVGFIGLGNMGGRISRWIVEAGFPLTLWARRAASLEPFAATATLTSSPAEVGRASDIVGVCVWGDADVEEVLGGPEGVLAGMAPGGIVMVHSTVAPETCRRLAATAAATGVTVVDAPVSIGTVAGRLLVMVGGDRAAVDRCRPVLESFGDPIVHLGPLGSGQLGKLVNNSLLAANMALAQDAVDLGVAFGLDGPELTSALLHGSSTSMPGTTMLVRTREMLADQGRPGAPRSATVNWAKKDIRLTVDEARRRGIAVDRPVLVLGEVGARLATPPAT